MRTTKAPAPHRIEFVHVAGVGYRATEIRPGGAAGMRAEGSYHAALGEVLAAMHRRDVAGSTAAATDWNELRRYYMARGLDIGAPVPTAQAAAPAAAPRLTPLERARQRGINAAALERIAKLNAEAAAKAARDKVAAEQAEKVAAMNRRIDAVVAEDRRIQERVRRHRSGK